MGRTTTRRARGWRALGAPALAIALLGAACGDDDGDDATAEEQPEASEILGEANPAEGEPILVGFAHDSGSEASDVSEYETAAQAAAEYVNEHLGGIGGRPIEITFCGTRVSAAGASDCANEFIQAGVSAVLVGSTGAGAALAGPIGAAGIPYVAHLGATNEELAGPTSFSLTGSVVSILGSPAVIMQDRGLERLAVMTIDVPTATQAVQALAVPVYEQAGLDLELITVPPGTADMSANVSAAGDVDMWLVLGDAAFCTTALSAIRTQAPDDLAFLSGQCVSADNASSIPGGFEGVLTTSSTRLDPDDPEVQLYRAVLDTYVTESLSGAADGFLSVGFSTVVAFARLMDGYTGDGSPATVLEQLQGAGGLLPLGGGIEMRCGSSPIEFLPALCSLGSWLSELDADGDPVDFELVDPSALFGG